LIDDILDEEKAANSKLTALAEMHCNLSAQTELSGHAV